jgi:hypothetical protein
MLLSRSYFDEVKCEQGLEALRQYSADYDENLRTLKSKPRHDWTSHAADAARTLAMGLKPPKPKSTTKPPIPKYIV